MHIYRPYTYLLKFKPTGQLYYGCSYANNKAKTAHPSQLWCSYFTSSKIIKRLIQEHGIESFEYQVRRTFKTAEAALLWEQKLLTRVNAVKSTNWLNRTNGNKKFYLTDDARKRMSEAKKGKKLSAETRKKLSEICKNRSEDEKIAIKIKASKSLTGRKQSEETKQKISNSHKGRSFTDDHRQKISDSRRGQPGPRKGKKASPETIERMRNAALKWHKENSKS